MPAPRAARTPTEHRPLVQAVDLSAGVDQAVAASRLVVGGAVEELCGFAIVESTGAAAANIALHDGGGTANDLLAPILLPVSGYAFQWLAPLGLCVSTGKLYLEVIAGSVRGVVFVRMAHRHR